MGKRNPRFTSKGKGLWYAAPWWQNTPHEPMVPERINDDESQLGKAFVRGQLGKDRREVDRYHAGTTYRNLFEILHRSGRDSLMALGVSGGSGMSFTNTQQQAGRDLAKVKEKLSSNDAGIIEMYCGKNHNMTTAVLAFVPYPSNSVLNRLCEALDALDAALDEQRIKRAA